MFLPLVTELLKLTEVVQYLKQKLSKKINLDSFDNYGLKLSLTVCVNRNISLIFLDV